MIHRDPSYYPPKRYTVLTDSEAFIEKNYLKLAPLYD
jgi:hypothetical protein